MTVGPNSVQDPIWAAALDWVLRLNAHPEDGELRAGLTAWLAQREAHAKAYRRAQKVWQLTGEVAPAHAEAWKGRAAVESRPRPGSQVRASLGRSSPSRGAWRRKTVLAAGVLAASLVLLIGSGSWPFVNADYATGVGETRELTLADGSVVTLGGDSALSVKYAKTSRDVVLLKGEAFFQVVHDPDRPFLVQAEGMTAEDIGTAFDVAIEAERLQVSVQSGTVRVSYDQGPMPLSETLEAGDRLDLEKGTGAATRDRETPAAIASWRSGRMVVENVSIDQIVQTLRHYHPGFIWVRDADLAGRRISGVYDLNDPFGALKAAVEPHAGVVTQVTPYLLIVSGP